MVAFLSDGWIGALDRAAKANDGLRRAVAEVTVVVDQEVTDVDGGTVTYHLTFDRGDVSVRPGPACAATVRFSQDLATAVAIATGAGSAQRAFMAGSLRVGGDLGELSGQTDALAQIGDVFAAVRAETEFPDVTGSPAGA